MALIQEQPIVLETLNDREPKPANNTPHRFELFQKTPSELKIKIWKMSFVPRRIILKTASDRPAMDPRSSAGLLLVNFEAREIFLENYTKYFDNRGQGGMFLNFELDTLCFDAGLLGLETMITLYPSAMNDVRWIDIKAPRADIWQREPHVD
jgi:hypothetical protein